MKQCGMTFFREETRQEGKKIVRKRRVWSAWGFSRRMRKKTGRDTCRVRKAEAD